MGAPQRDIIDSRGREQAVVKRAVDKCDSRKIAGRKVAVPENAVLEVGIGDVIVNECLLKRLIGGVSYHVWI